MSPRSPLRLGIPWYLHPAEGADAWDQLAERFAGADGLADGFAVVNVHDGPGDEHDPYYGPALSRLTAAAPGLLLLGYIDFDYGMRSLEDVLDDAAAWEQRYGIRGVMLDRFPSGSEPGSSRAVDDALETVARLREAGVRYVAGNPGTVPAPELAHILDITCEFEGTGHDYAALELYGGPGSWHLVHSCTPDELRAAQAIALTTGVDHVFFTDVPMPHPWNGFSGNYTC